MTPLWPERPLRNACLIVGSETIQRLRRDQHTHRLPAIAVCSRGQEVICRACTRLFTRGLSRALLLLSVFMGIVDFIREEIVSNCELLRCEVSLKFAANLIPVMLCNFVVASAVASNCDRSIRQSKRGISSIPDVEIFFRVSVSRYTNVVGNINVISWNLFRYISLLLFVALFFP